MKRTQERDSVNNNVDLQFEIDLSKLKKSVNLSHQPSRKFVKGDQRMIAKQIRNS